MGKEAEFEVLPMPTLSIDGAKISSSGIRRCLEKGDVTTPYTWCEAPFEIAGTVISGAGRGKGLGFPTANIKSDWPTWPRQGVYAVECLFSKRDSFYGVANLGLRPTFEDPNTAKETLEVHLLDAGSPDLYGKSVQVRFLQRLRDERQFENKEALMEQISQDIEQARKVLKLKKP
jgi:riboflavin kinase/FMN adenylyltransferase